MLAKPNKKKIIIPPFDGSWREPSWVSLRETLLVVEVTKICLNQLGHDMHRHRSQCPEGSYVPPHRFVEICVVMVWAT